MISNVTSRSLSMNKVKVFLFLSHSFFVLPMFLSKLLALSSDSLVTTQSSRKLKRQHPTLTTFIEPLSHRCMPILLEPHLPPRVRVRLSLGKPTSLLWYLPYLQLLAHRSHLSLAAEAATTYQQYLLSLIHQPYTCQHRCRLWLPVLFLHRALTLTPWLAGPPPRGVEVGWITTIIITVVHLMSHIMIDFSCDN